METHEVPDTLAAVAASFRDARGEQADEDWARSAAARFALDGVRPLLARRVLAELVPVIREADEPAHELFGAPVDWARERQAAWRAEGVQATGPTGPTSVRGFVHDLFFGAAVVAVVMTPLRMLVDGWRYELDLALILFPLLMAAGILGLQLTWNALIRRASRGLALLGSTGLLVVLVGVTVGVFLVAVPVSVGQVSGFWLLAAATGYGIVATVVGRVWPAPEAPEPVELVESDDDWMRALTADLRQRGDFTEARARAVVAEAQTHARDAHRRLYQEFGSPRSYAARFAPDDVVQARRTAWRWTAAALPPVVLFLLGGAEDGWQWRAEFIGFGIWFAAAGLLAVVSWRRAVRARRRRA